MHGVVCQNMGNKQQRVLYMPVARRSYTIDKKPVGTELEFMVDGVLKRKLSIIQKLGQGGVDGN
jgi:hypothetical protein